MKADSAGTLHLASLRSFSCKRASLINDFFRTREPLLYLHGVLPRTLRFKHSVGRVLAIAAVSSFEGIYSEMPVSIFPIFPAPALRKATILF